MKIRKEHVIGAIVLTILIAGGITGVNLLQDKERSDFAKRIAELGKGGVPVGIDDLKEAIRLYEKEIDRLVSYQDKAGTYYKILATRQQDRGLHTDALDSLQEALRYFPDDSALPYMMGVSAAFIGRSYISVDGTGSGERDRYLAMAEESFRTAMKMDENYYRPVYSLAILYVNDLARPQDAIPLLERYLSVMKNDFDAMFVLARAYYQTGRYEDAIDEYNEIIAKSPDKTRKDMAQQNKEIVMEAYYG
ncbi:MAG: tetratricopeptide repeat protein [Spirochaetaceae bacterium]|nr:tetratricopeptide repeat protein [Spirochaetaceae bacterium]